MFFHALARLLRWFLVVDAVSCAATGIAGLALTVPLAQFLGIPQTWVFEGGLICLVFAALPAIVASRSVIPRGGVMLVVAGNVAWGVTSLAVVISGTIEPNLAGKIVIMGQGVLVLLIAEAQFLASRALDRPADIA